MFLVQRITTSWATSWAAESFCAFTEQVNTLRNKPKYAIQILFIKAVCKLSPQGIGLLLASVLTTLLTVRRGSYQRLTLQVMGSGNLPSAVKRKRKGEKDAAREMQEDLYMSRKEAEVTATEAEVTATQAEVRTVTVAQRARRRIKLWDQAGALIMEHQLR